jgi:hypothetical protein
MKTTVKVPSMAIDKIQYDDKTKLLTLVMAYGPPKNHNEVLMYKGVPKDIFNAFLAAPSKGAFFNKHIRNDYDLV